MTRATKLVASILLFFFITDPAEAYRGVHRYHSYTLKPYYPKNDYRPRAWCGWWMRMQLGVRDANYNLARNWARYGRPASGPSVGVIVVWYHHVGRIVGPCTGNFCLIQSGNDGHAVRTRLRSVAGAIAFRTVSNTQVLGVAW